MRYVTEKYVAGGTAIQAFTDDDEPYATCSICLAEYGFVPKDNEIVVPVYKLVGGAAEKIIADLADEVLGTVTFGPYGAEGRLIRLKKEYWPEDCGMPDRTEEDMTAVEQIEDLVFNIWKEILGE